MKWQNYPEFFLGMSEATKEARDWPSSNDWSAARGKDLYSGVGLECVVNVEFGFLENSRESCQFFHFAVILVPKKRYKVNKRITRFIFANHLSSYYSSQTLHLYKILKRIQNFLILLYKTKSFSAYMKNTFSLPSSSYAWPSRKLHSVPQWTQNNQLWS